MSRASYEAARRRQRAALDPREARGLPHHPDGTGYATCPECEGAGELTRNDSAIRDPQCEYPATCPVCFGDGQVRDGHEDPLVAMRKNRARRFRPGWAGVHATHSYREARKRAMSPVALPGTDRAEPQLQPIAGPSAVFMDALSSLTGYRRAA